MVPTLVKNSPNYFSVLVKIELAILKALSLVILFWSSDLIECLIFYHQFWLKNIKDKLIILNYLVSVLEKYNPVVELHIVVAVYTSVCFLSCYVFVTVTM